ncbi:MAG: type II toxin-antitoxin system Phd/YefM family antitoxin [Gemmatimonadota bacterium]
MKTVSISELKARLSQYIDAVRSGHEVIVTDRGTPVARLSAVVGARGADARLRDLVRTGRIRPPLRRGRVDFDSLELPADPESLGLQALLEERRGGR